MGAVGSNGSLQMAVVRLRLIRKYKAVGASWMLSKTRLAVLKVSLGSGSWAVETEGLGDTAKWTREMCVSVSLCISALTPASGKLSPRIRSVHSHSQVNSSHFDVEGKNTWALAVCLGAGTFSPHSVRSTFPGAGPEALCPWQIYHCPPGKAKCGHVAALPPENTASLLSEESRGRVPQDRRCLEHFYFPQLLAY